MEQHTFRHTAQARAAGSQRAGIVGVVASGNLEVLLERVVEGRDCEFFINTPVKGFGEVWGAVVADVVERTSAGGLRLSINDGGAGPDMVTLRLLQGIALMEGL